jgi:signal peptidase I
MAAAKVGAAGMGGLLLDTTQIRHFVFGPRPRRTLCRVAAWSTLLLAFFHHLLVPIQIIGSSMAPTYRNGSLNLVNRWSYTKRPPVRGDVIALNSEGELLLKRIIALPGELVAIFNGQIYVNRNPLADPFSTESVPWEMDPIRLGIDEFFVIGDNRSASIFCKVCRKDIIGKTIF